MMNTGFRMVSLLAALLVLLSSPSTAEQVFKYRDGNGRLVYSDQPPPGAKPGSAVSKAIIGSKGNGLAPPPRSRQQPSPTPQIAASSAPAATLSSPPPPSGGVPRSGAASASTGGVGGGGGSAASGGGSSLPAGGGAPAAAAQSGGAPTTANTALAVTSPNGPGATAPAASPNPSASAAAAPVVPMPSTASGAPTSAGAAPTHAVAASSPASTASEVRVTPTAPAPVAAPAAQPYQSPPIPTVYVLSPGVPPKPFDSIDAAVGTLKGGDTLSIPAGTFRMFIDLRLARNLASTVSAQRPLTIAGAPGAARTHVKGSDVVTGWQDLGNGLWEKRPWDFNSQQVFVDGQSFQQVGGIIYGGFPRDPANPYNKLNANEGGIWPGRVPETGAVIPEGSFQYDDRSRRLLVRYSSADLNTRHVEASVRPYLLLGSDARFVTVRDITFEHSNTSTVNRLGAVTMSGTNLTFERLTIRDVDAKGLVVSGTDNVIADSLFERCGQLGLQAQGQRFRIVGNAFRSNNTRGFNTWWEAGGAKFVGEQSLTDSEVSANAALRNRGDGLWFDWGNANDVIRNNVVAYNTGMGIHYEASRAASIHDNYAYANGLRGIYAPHSSDVVIAHNLIVANGMDGAVVVDEGRRDSSGKLDLKPKSNRIVGNVFGWNARYTVTLPDRANGNLSDGNLFLDPDDKLVFSLGWPGPTNPQINGLARWRASTSEDQESWPQVLPMPPSIAAAMAAGNLIEDWSAIQSVAARHAVPASVYDRARISSLATGASSAPGPRK